MASIIETLKYIYIYIINKYDETITWGFFSIIEIRLYWNINIILINFKFIGYSSLPRSCHSAGLDGAGMSEGSTGVPFSSPYCPDNTLPLLEPVSEDQEIHSRRNNGQWYSHLFLIYLYGIFVSSFFVDFYRIEFLCWFETHGLWYVSTDFLNSILLLIHFFYVNSRRIIRISFL